MVGENRFVRFQNFKSLSPFLKTIKHPQKENTLKYLKIKYIQNTIYAKYIC